MFLSIKNIPKVYWSSDKSFNLKPKISTSFFLIFGLIIFGFGEGLLILSTTGNSPWSVLAEGISKNSKLSIGAATFLVSVSVLLLWIFLKQKPGLGTIFNIIIISAMIDITLYFFDAPSSIWSKYLLSIFQIFVQDIRKLEIGNCVYCGLPDPGKHSVHSELLDTHDTSNLVWQ